MVYAKGTSPKLPTPGTSPKLPTPKDFARAADPREETPLAVCMYMYCVCMCTWICICACVCACICMFMCGCTCMCLHVYVCVYVKCICICICMCVCICIHISRFRCIAIRKSSCVGREPQKQSHVHIVLQVSLQILCITSSFSRFHGSCFLSLVVQVPSCDSCFFKFLPFFSFMLGCIPLATWKCSG